jgi:hypothetical protein
MGLPTHLRKPGQEMLFPTPSAVKATMNEQERWPVCGRNASSTQKFKAQPPLPWFGFRHQRYSPRDGLYRTHPSGAKLRLRSLLPLGL